MKRRWLMGTGIVAGIILLDLAFDPTYILWGLLRRDSFFQGRPTSYWRKKIQKNDPAVHESFGMVFGSEPNPDAVPVLIDLLTDEDDQVCYFAANVLVGIGAEAGAAVPVLLKILKHPNIYHRRNAANALAATVSGRPSREGVQNLIEAFEEEDAFVSYYCATALGRLGREAAEAQDALVKLSRSPIARQRLSESPLWKDTVGDAAEWALEQIQPPKEL